ncbi:hypothetical protein, partial [Candidatus Symbiothrix dinenymphae]|uniref:hypothetical protein n=1 Tax=Candidatus Symbiothrix dinenymphae TaxID=467085 RepID=UPI000A8B9C34
ELPPPTVNVYIENSGSMDGYVRGMTDMEKAVYGYLSDMKLADAVDTLNLFYINSKIIRYASNADLDGISNFIEKLNPASFVLRGGYRGVSDISDVIKAVLAKTEPNHVSILVTDGIFSPERGKNADDYLEKQEIGLKNSFKDYLKYVNDNAAIVVYQLNSGFKGKYFYFVKNKNADNIANIEEDAEDDVNIKAKAKKKKRKSKPKRENLGREAVMNYVGDRPFYIWLIGDADYLTGIRTKVPEHTVKGSGVLNMLSLIPGDRKVSYAIQDGSGRFEWGNETTIRNWKKNNKGRNLDVSQFSINVDFSYLLLDDDYLTDAGNYLLSDDDFHLTVSKAAIGGYSHVLTVSSAHVKKGPVSIKLKMAVPEWVEEMTEDEGSNPAAGKTYGFKYQIQGAYEGFTFGEKDFYTEIKINII